MNHFVRRCQEGLLRLTFYRLSFHVDLRESGLILPKGFRRPKAFFVRQTLIASRLGWSQVALPLVLFLTLCNGLYAKQAPSTPHNSLSGSAMHFLASNHFVEHRFSFSSAVYARTLNPPPLRRASALAIPFSAVLASSYLHTALITLRGQPSTEVALRRTHSHPTFSAGARAL